MVKLCKFIGHRWEPEDAWGSRSCKFCHNVELRFYTKERGTYWEKIS